MSPERDIPYTEPEGPWAAAVLCGGASRRMGRDKALLVVEGEPMARRVAAATRAAGAARVITVGGDEPGLRVALAGLAVTPVADRFPGEGPLGGILTALAELDEEIVLVVACDLVRPAAPAMAATVAALTRLPADEAAADVAVPERDGRQQWLHGAWRRSERVRDGLATQFAGGERSVHRAVAGAGLRVLDVPLVAREALADADAPEDLPTET